MTRSVLPPRKIEKAKLVVEFVRVRKWLLRVCVISHGSSFYRPQSSSASRRTAGACGFLNLSQSGEGPGKQIRVRRPPTRVRRPPTRVLAQSHATHPPTPSQFLSMMLIRYSQLRESRLATSSASGPSRREKNLLTIRPQLSPTQNLRLVKQVPFRKRRERASPWRPSCPRRKQTRYEASWGRTRERDPERPDEGSWVSVLARAARATHKA
jgi:hypothetical protein